PRREQINSSQEAEALTVVTLRNLCIDKLRKSKVAQTELNEWRDIDNAERIDERLEIQEQYCSIERIINEQLSPIQQRILHLKEFEGLTIEAIATELSMQPTAVRMQLSRARKRVRTCYYNISKDESR
ncbi:MAG: RNA polymerase sigma factor, partial [Phocaeicola sp.]